MKRTLLVTLLVVIGIPAAMVPGMLAARILDVRSGPVMALVMLPFMLLVGWIAIRLGRSDAHWGAPVDPLVAFGLPGVFAFCIGGRALLAGDMTWGPILLGLGTALAIPAVVVLRKRAV